MGTEKEDYREKQKKRVGCRQLKEEEYHETN